MQERYIRPDEEKPTGADGSGDVEIDAKDFLFAWIELIMENPKNKEIIRKIHELEYNKKLDGE